MAQLSCGSSWQLTLFRSSVKVVSILFNARSVFLAQSTFPWLVATSISPQTDHRFAGLRISFDGQTRMQTREANRLLLIIFTDILASLIGEQLTTQMVRLAWGNNIQDRSGKEFSDE